MSRRFVDNTQTVANDPNSSLQVIAAGQWRAATSTLQHVFENQLSPTLGPSMHGAYIMAFNDRMKLCCALCRETSKTRRQAMLHQLYTGYNSCSDFPGIAFLEDLLEIFPKAKVILNKRKSAKAWEKSVQDSLAIYGTRLYFIATCLVPHSYWHYSCYREYMNLCKRRFGTDQIFTAEFYEQHNQWVRDVIRADGRELLEWDPSMGIEPLCEFLGRDVSPEAEKQLPRINDNETHHEIRRYFFLRGLKAWAMVLAAPAVLLLADLWMRTSNTGGKWLYRPFRS